MEVPEVLEEEEIELSLGLSIGGKSFRKFEKESNQKSISSITFDVQICENETESRIENDDSQSCLCSSSLPVNEVEDDQEDDYVLDPEKMRREIHKMRRQEARNKQIHKKNGRKDFSLMRNEDEEGSEKQICKKLKSEENVKEEFHDQTLNQSFCEINPITPMQYGFQSMQMQYVPFGNGFTFPYHMMMPYWIPPITSSSSSSPNNGDNDNNGVVHPIACRSFKPISFENSVMNRELPVENYGGAKATGSSGSAASSSSAVSDYRNGSQHGGSSNETRSHSSQSPPLEQPQPNVAVMSNVQVQSELSTSSNPTKSTRKTSTNTNNVVYSNTAQANPSKMEEKLVPFTDPQPIDKPDSTTDYPPAFLQPPQQSKGANVENYKPPKPQPPRQLKRTNEEANKPLTPEPTHQLKGDSNQTPKLIQPLTESLPQMPCVSTVGNGPNGKTITGFLYRYTKTEVSIICVCHGSSFSPAEFVKHAGGTDVSHPLKHIVVVPSAVA